MLGISRAPAAHWFGRQAQIDLSIQFDSRIPQNWKILQKMVENLASQSSKQIPYYLYHGGGVLAELLNPVATSPFHGNLLGRLSAPTLPPSHEEHRRFDACSLKV